MRTSKYEVNDKCFTCPFKECKNCESREKKEPRRNRNRKEYMSQYMKKYSMTPKMIAYRKEYIKTYMPEYRKRKELKAE